MPEITWQNPPATTRGRNGWRHAIVEELAKHPGQWALVETTAKNSGVADGWKRLGCESTTRTRRDGEEVAFDIYARFPEQQEEEVTAAE